MRHSKIIVAIAAACLLLCGCQRAAPRTLYDGESLKVTQQGKKTIIHDMATNKEYVLIRNRVRKSEIKPGAKTLIKTDSLTISTEGGTTTIRTATGVFLTISKGKIRR